MIFYAVFLYILCHNLTVLCHDILEDLLHTQSSLLILHYIAAVLGTWHRRWVWLETSTWRCFPSSDVFTPVLIDDWHWLSDCICCIVHHHYCHHWRVVYWV